ncbi:hypothetical protein TSAR_011741 [Trichomalopsis sarcophagae]|uniref:Uncharacterized protein n=1 Tax=Trichomalopsis sarcophagae TaxID=543379 RepID=A0A232EQS1_9HYME|nr:hypothetical protein TSAR_011741 [Trichomalopsis sarcophagae]
MGRFSSKLLLRWTREMVDSEARQNPFFAANSYEDSSDEEDDSEPPWDPVPAHAGPECHQETWEDPESSETCSICLRSRGVPPACVNPDEA